MISRAATHATVLLALALLAAPAWADRDPAAAEALFRAAKAALEGGELELACSKFRESNALDPAPGTLFNLAGCEEKRGRIGTAWALFVEVRQKLDPSDERGSTVDARIAALEPRLARLTLRLADGAPASTRVSRNGVPVGAGSLGVALVVDPGTQQLVVEADGHERRLFAIDIAEGKSGAIVVEPGPALPAPPEPEPRHGDEAGDEAGAKAGAEPTYLHPIGLTLLGVGVAGLAVGVGLGVEAKGRYDEAETLCPAQRCSQLGFDQREDARALGNIATGVFVAGAALAAAGAVVEIVALTRGADEEQALVLLPSPGGLSGRYAW
jgi:tetratricopeptide (TPR) repeat protein